MDCLSELSSSRLNRPFASEFLALVFPYLFIYSCKRWVNLINDDNILMMENAVVFMSQLFRYPSLCACVCPSLYLFMLVCVCVLHICESVYVYSHTWSVIFQESGAASARRRPSLPRRSRARRVPSTGCHFLISTLLHIPRVCISPPWPFSAFSLIPPPPEIKSIVVSKKYSFGELPVLDSRVIMSMKAIQDQSISFAFLSLSRFTSFSHPSHSFPSSLCHSLHSSQSIVSFSHYTLLSLFLLSFLHPDF